VDIKKVPIASVIPYARNPRKNQGAIAKVAASLREFGWQQPIVVDSEMTVIVGHTRLEAARTLGMTEVPVHVAVGLTPAQVRAYRLADNRTNEEAEWDEDLLKLELHELKDEEFDLALTGFDDRELMKLLLDDDEMARAEETPEPPVNPTTVLGDVWVLGNHRIICGDSTKAEDVDKVLNGVKPHLMVTDPPYGVNYDASWRSEVNNDGPDSKRAVGKVLNDDRADWSEAWALFPGDVAYVWHAGVFSPMVASSLECCSFTMRALIVWAKQRHTFGRGHYHHMHEPCWYAVKKSGTGHWSGDRKQTTLWSIENNRSNETGHSTQKPVECMRRPIMNNSSPGQAVYEPFSGSGTTIIAGEMTGRHVYAIELNPAYVDVAVERWQTFTGQKAVHAVTGQTYEEVADGRYDQTDDCKRSYDAGIVAMREKLAGEAA